MENDFEIRSLKEFDVQGAVVIHCIPSMNVQPSIVASYLVETLNMDQIACCDSHAFPPASMIYGAKPKFPARAYVNQTNDMVVSVADMKDHHDFPTSYMMHRLCNSLQD